jgi:hyperosmotically inducible periplasmic protein
MDAKLFGASLVILTALAVPAMAQDGRKNDEIFKDVQDQVLTYAQFTIFDDVSAAIDNGVVTLEGKVTMPFKRDDIGRRVQKVPGVTHVENKIAVLPVSPFDDDLRYAIARAIYGSSAFWSYASMANPPIHIIVDHGRVTLTGVVNSEVDRMLARSLASSFGAFSVTSQLKTDAEMKAILDRRGH